MRIIPSLGSKRFSHVFRLATYWVHCCSFYLFIGMTAWWTHHIKHPELIERYRSFEWKKTTYRNFLNRVLNQLYEKEKAIIDTCYTGKRKIKWTFDNNWRECTNCKEYKEWKLFAKMKSWIHWRAPNCLECRRDKKRAYREKTNYEKDHEYKERTRKLEIWSIIMITQEAEKDLLELWYIQKRKVINYKFKKWYTIQSEQTRKIRTIDTNDNKATNKNSLKFILYN